MPQDQVASAKTTLHSEEVLVRSVQFFTNSMWRVQSQSSRVATFVGAARVSMVQLLLAILLTMCFVIPGVLYYFFVIRDRWGMKNIVVTATPAEYGCDLVVTYHPRAQEMVQRFIAALPKV